MSLPKDLLDQLLTGYLDNALTEDERARVEQLMQSDPEVADEVAQLRDLQKSLKAIGQIEANVQLGTGFADRVLDAAVARAHSEGLDDDHPLVRLAEQPSTSQVTSDSSNWKIAAVLVGLAASIALAVILLRPDPQLAGGFQVAGTDPVVPVEPIDNPEVIPEVVTEPGSVTPEMVATNDSVTPGVPVANDPVVTPVDPTVVPENEPTESVASVQDPVMQPVPTPEGAINTGAIVVVHVRRTDTGRATDAVGRAMRTASIAPTTEKKITDEIAGFVPSDEPPNSKLSVLYLQASIKSLDKFYLRLMADPEGIESVGLTIAFDAPIMNAVGAIRPHPTEIRDDTSLLLTSDNGFVEQFSDRLGNLQFAPYSGDVLKKQKGADGPDEMGQILLLVE